DVAHREPRAVAIAPRLADHRRQDAFGTDLADALEVVFEHALLRRDLRGGFDVLHRAAAAGAEVAAAGRHALRALAHHARHRAEVEVAAAPAPRELDRLAGHAAVEEDDLPVDVRDPDALVVDGLDEGFGHRYWQSVAGLPKTCREMSLVTLTPSTLYVIVPSVPVSNANVIVPTLVAEPAAQGA